MLFIAMRLPSETDRHLHNAGQQVGYRPAFTRIQIHPVDILDTVLVGDIENAGHHW